MPLSRKKLIEKQVPDLIDLVVVAVEAGTGIDGAIQYVSERLGGPLAEECMEVARQVRNGREPREVWMELSARLGIPDFTDFVGIVLQARSMNVDVGHTLRDKANQIRERRTQLARQEAAKLPSKLIFVNVFFVPLLVMEVLAFAILPRFPAFCLIGLAVSAFLINRGLAAGKRDAHKIERQLGDALIQLANGMRAGFSLSQAFRTTAPHIQEPLGRLFRRIADKVSSGGDVIETFEKIAKEKPSPDINLVVTAVVLQHRGRGSLAEILDRVSFVIRDRNRIRDEIQSLTSQPRYSALLLTAIPLGIGLFMQFVGIKMQHLLPTLERFTGIGAAGIFFGVLCIFALQGALNWTVTLMMKGIEKVVP